MSCTERISTFRLLHFNSATLKEAVDNENPNVIKDTQSAERYFLEGPRSRRKELFFLFKVFKDFLRGIRALHFVGPCVTVFGSARFKEEHPYYKQSMEVGAALAQMGFTVMTGGGPGVMEAANRGAKEAGGYSVGCNIILPMEQYSNKYLDKSVDIKFFFVRKVLLSKYSYAFVCMPGGMGTMDEMFEAVTLVQTNKMERFPIVLFGKEYYKKLYDHILHMVDEGTVSASDLDLFLYTDSVEEMVHYLETFAVKKFGLKKKKHVLPFSWLGEKKSA
ncbi:MAG: hypothetical protein JWM14_939 [Chitinophagaceae bacterium]|nr:hypothetical protein [Chitinophagaceae bacterium]